MHTVSLKRRVVSGKKRQQRVSKSITCTCTGDFEVYVHVHVCMTLCICVLDVWIEKALPLGLSFFFVAVGFHRCSE